MGVTRMPMTLPVVVGSAGALDPVAAADAVGGGGALAALLSGFDAHAQSGIVSRIAQACRFIVLLLRFASSPRWWHQSGIFRRRAQPSSEYVTADS
jgi:hypothetical protein